jgi:hypothetical protein
MGDSPLVEAAYWALEHFAHLDQANACIHCSPVRYSPITVRLAQALEEHIPRGDSEPLDDVLDHVGRYPLDPGRIELDPKETTGGT